MKNKQQKATQKPRGGPKGPTKAKLIEAIRQCAGNVAEITQMLGWKYDRGRTYEWIDKFELREELATARELLVDVAESNVKSAVFKDKNVETSIFILRTLGRRRGYGENVTISQSRESSQEEVDKLFEEMHATDKN